MQESGSLAKTSANSHIPQNVTLNQSSEKSPDGTDQSSKLEEGKVIEVQTKTSSGFFYKLFKRKRKEKFTASKMAYHEKNVKLVEDNKEVNADHVKVVESPSTQPKIIIENAEAHYDQQNQESVMKGEAPQVIEPEQTLMEAAAQPTSCSNLSEVPFQSSQPSMNVVVHYYRHSVISIEEPENEPFLEGPDQGTPGESRTLRIALRTTSATEFTGDKNTLNEGKVSDSSDHGLICQGSFIHRSDVNNIYDEETYDYANQSNNNAANDISSSAIEFALPEPERKPAKFLELIREARAANMIPPSLPTPSYSWERKESIEEENCMVLPTRKPKKRNENASVSSEPEKEINNTSNDDVNKPKPVPSLQEVIATMQKIKEAEAQLRAIKERRQFSEVKNDTGEFQPSNQSTECIKESVPVDYKERRRLRREREIEEARKELMEATRNALLDRIAFNKKLKSQINADNVGKALFGVSTDDINYQITSFKEPDKSVDIMESQIEEPVQDDDYEEVDEAFDDEKIDNTDLSHVKEPAQDYDYEEAVEAYDDEKIDNSELPSNNEFTKEGEDSTCKKETRQKKHSNKHKNHNSTTFPALFGGQHCPVPQTTGMPQNIPNMSMAQPIFIPVPICVSCSAAPQWAQLNCCNQLNHSWNSIAHGVCRRYCISSSETSTSSESDVELHKRKSKRKHRLSRRKSDCGCCSNYGDMSSSSETESSVSPTNSSFSMPPSDQESSSYTTSPLSSSASSFSTNSECSAFSFSSSKSGNRSSY